VNRKNKPKSSEASELLRKI